MFKFSPTKKALSIALFSFSVLTGSSAFAATESVSSAAALNGDVDTYQAAPIVTWKWGVKYEKGTEVVYDGVTYVAKWPSKGKKPGVTTAWSVLVTGTDVWDASVKYTMGTDVTHNGETYKAKWSQTGKVPGESGAWILVEDNTGNAWVSSVKYAKDAEVTYNGMTYTAKWSQAGKIPGVSGVWKLDAVIVDETRPIITLNGSDITLAVDSIYNELGAQVTDNVDNNLSVIITGTVDASVIDSYIIKYDVTDTAGNIALTVNRIVNVVATVGPGLCADIPLWVEGTVAKGGDVYYTKEDEIAFAAKWESITEAGSDDGWTWELNCDGTDKGAAALLSLPTAKDPVSLKVNGWPSDFVVASPASSQPMTILLDEVSTADLTDYEKLVSTFISLIQTAEQAGTASIIISNSVLDNIVIDDGLSLGTIPVKQALSEALATTGTTGISSDSINALSDDVKGWAQAQNLVLSTLATNATFGWNLHIGDFAYDNLPGKRAVWNAAAKPMSRLLSNLELYKGASKADFIAFTKSSLSASLSSEQWHNALQYVKQVTDFVQAPAILSSVPTTQAATYFMGATVGESNIRKAAANNIFAILFDANSTSLTSKIESYQNTKVPLYYEGSGSGVTPITSITSLNSELESLESVVDNEVFLYETPSSQWVPSTIYKWADFLTGLNSMHNVGVAGNKFWLTDDAADDATNAKYAKVAIAAFLSQSMQETIRFDACDENNWSEVKYGANIDYPMTASCGQLGQKYADYGTHPESGKDHAYSCPRDNTMEQTALTHAKWYGAPGPIFVAPDAVLEDMGLLINGNAGHWSLSGSWCGDVPTIIDESKQAFERNDCQLYVGQKDGQYVWDGTDTGGVEGCGWWGRGVIQTTGRQNFGTLNHFVGRSHVDPATIGTTIDGTTVEAAPESPLYADLDLCSNPGLVCSSEEHKEIKWIAGLFFWVSSVQAYENVGGPYEGWNYHAELKKYVDEGMTGTAFVDAVSGIVNRGCPDDHCPVSGEVHAIDERRANFKLVLQKLGLNPQ